MSKPPIARVKRLNIKRPDKENKDTGNLTSRGAPKKLLTSQSCKALFNPQ